MPDVGIKLSMSENVSAMSPKVSTALRDISSAGEEMKEALQLDDLEEKYQQFAERIDKLYDTQQAGRGQQQDGARQQRDVDRQAQQTQQRMSTLPTQMLGGMGTAATRAGTGAIQQLGQGDIAGAGLGITGVLGGMVKALTSPVGLVIAGLTGLAIGANELVKQYEKVIPTVMDLTASLGKLGETAGESSKAFGEVFDEVSEAAAKYSYTLEQGAGVFKALAEAGGRPTAEEAERVMAYGRGYNAPLEFLSRYTGTGARFGMEGNFLAVAAGGLERAGMNEARLQEFMNSTLSIFEEGLSKGIVRGFDDIIKTQAWMAEAGEEFRGQAGLNIYQRMAGGVAGATALQTEQDALMFQAASKVVGRMTTGERKEAGLEPGWWGVMQYMERGLTPELFEQGREDILARTASREGALQQMSMMFAGGGHELAVKLMEMTSGKAYEEITGKEAPVTIGTDEMNLLKAGLNIQRLIRKLGRGLLPKKVGLVGNVSKIMDKISEMFAEPLEGIDSSKIMENIQDLSEDIFGTVGTTYAIPGEPPKPSILENIMGKLIEEGQKSEAERLGFPSTPPTKERERFDSVLPLPGMEDMMDKFRDSTKHLENAADSLEEKINIHIYNTVPGEEELEK